MRRASSTSMMPNARASADGTGIAATVASASRSRCESSIWRTSIL